MESWYLSTATIARGTTVIHLFGIYNHNTLGCCFLQGQVISELTFKG